VNTYLVVKTLHILSATLMVGTGFGTAFYMFWVNRSGSVAAQSVVARWVVRLLSQVQPHPFEVDADLRPEGRQGPMSRSLGSYADYYERWSAVWERQALLRARACAGESAASSTPRTRRPRVSPG